MLEELLTIPTLLAIETGLAILLSLVAVFLLFYVIDRFQFIQQVVLPGRDESVLVDDYLSMVDEEKWTQKEWRLYHSNSIRDAARILAMALVFYAIITVAAPLV